ncbi:MAG TPA: A24 family peptidase [Caulobacteraceae bacterium]
MFALSGGFLGWRIGTELGVAAACLSAMALIDLRYLVIPDLHVVMLGVVALAGPLSLAWTEAGVGALIGGGLLFAVRALFRWRTGRDALGLGDIKLMLALGALCGPEAVLWSIVAASALGIGVGLVRNRLRLLGASVLPFGALAAGPALAALAFIAVGATP